MHWIVTQKKCDKMLIVTLFSNKIKNPCFFIPIHKHISACAILVHQVNQPIIIGKIILKYKHNQCFAAQEMAKDKFFFQFLIHCTLHAIFSLFLLTFTLSKHLSNFRLAGRTQLSNTKFSMCKHTNSSNK